MSKKVTLEGYICEKCGKVYAGNGNGTDKYLADTCCKQYYCEDCGKPTEKYCLVCEECAEKRKFKKAKKMSYSEYEKQFPDYPIYYNEDFFWEIEDLEEKQQSLGLEMPKYVWGTIKERVEVNIQQALEDAKENSNLEDFYFENKQELIDFVEKWNKDNGTDAFYQSYNIAVLLDSEVSYEDN